MSKLIKSSAKPAQNPKPDLAADIAQQMTYEKAELLIQEQYVDKVLGFI
jgi:hypothetical protein